MQAVLFDLWETLITDAPELQRARQLWRAANLRTIFETAGVAFDSARLDAALGNTLHALSLLHDAGVDTDARGRVHILLAEHEKLGGRSPADRTHDAIEEAICTIPAGLYPKRMGGAVEMLQAVRSRGLKTGLISNAGITTAPTLRAMLDYYGLLPLLDVLVFSDEMRLAKPAPLVFETALQSIGVAPDDAVFVGDSPIHDLAGASAIGMRTVIIGRKQVEGLVPDARVDSLGALVGVLDRFENGPLAPEDLGP